MGVTEYGSSGVKPLTLGSDDVIAPVVRSILDLGSESVGDESSVDGTATGDAGAGSGDGEAFDPASLPSGGSSDRDAPFGRTPTGRARKRPVGSGTRGSGGNTGTGTPRKTVTEVSTFVADLLYGLHEIAANFTHTPELELSEDEATNLGIAGVRVAQEYDMPMPDAKTMAWVNLLKVVSVVYGPRVAAVRVRRAGERANKQPIPFTRMG
jgi:hypothetical protein